jgi:hypothetical protein
LSESRAASTHSRKRTDACLRVGAFRGRGSPRSQASANIKGCDFGDPLFGSLLRRTPKSLPPDREVVQEELRLRLFKELHEIPPCMPARKALVCSHLCIRLELRQFRTVSTHEPAQAARSPSRNPTDIPSRASSPMGPLLPDRQQLKKKTNSEPGRNHTPRKLCIAAEAARLSRDLLAEADGLCLRLRMGLVAVAQKNRIRTKLFTFCSQSSHQRVKFQREYAAAFGE